MKIMGNLAFDDLDYVKRKFVKNDVTGKYEQVWACPYYAKWKLMINRVFTKARSSSNMMYDGVLIDDSWRYFSNFKSWMINKDWEGNELDKDMMSVITGKREYSPDNCVFVSRNLNAFLVTQDSSRGIYPLGVRPENKGFYASMRIFGKMTRLGKFNTPEEAHKAWQLAKWEYGRELLSKQSDPRVIQAMHVILHKLGEDWSVGRITEKLV